MASLFDTLQAQAFRAGVTARTNASKKWFQANVKKLGQVNRTSLLKDDALEPSSRNIAGNMYMYFYDPKWKDQLPYYDRFPLTIMVEPAPGGFYGLNLHYLKPTIRAAFLDELMKTAPQKITDKSRIRARYKLLASSKKYKEFKPCFKHYLTEHVKSKLVRVPMSEWEVAIFLPTEQFVKKGKAAIWADSNKISRS
jgi:hypothetical protein